MKGKIGGIATGIIIALILIIAAACSERIPAGYVGVVYNMNGGIENEVLTQGWKFVSPTKKVTKFSIALEPSYMTADKQGDSSDDESFEIPTKEGASLETDVAFSYSYKLEEVPNTFTRFHGQNGEEILKTKRGTVNATLTERLGERFEAYGIVIDNIALADVRPDEDTARAITEKIQAQEALEKAKVNAEKDKVEANRDKEVATINAEKARIEAQGKADAKLISAEAEAQANRKIAESLTTELIELKRVEAKYKLAASLANWRPSVIGGNSFPMLDFNIGE